MKTFQEFITEIFDSSYDFTGPDEKVIQKGTILIMYQFRDKNNNDIQVGFSKSKEKDFWECMFTSNDVISLTGSGDSLKIFATVISIIQDFKKRKRPDKLGFSADKNEASRVSVYKRFVQRYAKQYNYKYEQKTIKEFNEEYFMINFQ